MKVGSRAEVWMLFALLGSACTDAAEDSSNDGAAEPNETLPQKDADRAGMGDESAGSAAEDTEASAAQSSCAEFPVHRDADGDGLGDPTSSRMVCSGDAYDGWVLDASDCDDADPNGVGDSSDADDDGTPAYCQTSYLQTRFRDCDDNDPTRHPSAEDPPFDGVDSNCDSADFPLTYDCSEPLVPEDTSLVAREGCEGATELFIAALSDCWSCNPDGPGVGSRLQLIVGNRGDGAVEAVLSFDGVKPEVDLGTLAPHSLSEVIDVEEPLAELPVRLSARDGSPNCEGAADSAYLEYRVYCDP